MHPELESEHLRRAARRLGGRRRPVADILLEELERSRDERMRDIVATIQADQFRLITREPEGVLVVQGGPGTGKTAVVVLVEPALIAAGGVEGLRALYVALTRTTKTLVVVHVEPLPQQLLPA